MLNRSLLPGGRDSRHRRHLAALQCLGSFGFFHVQQGQWDERQQEGDGDEGEEDVVAQWRGNQRARRHHGQWSGDGCDGAVQPGIIKVPKKHNQALTSLPKECYTLARPSCHLLSLGIGSEEQDALNRTTSH